MRLAFLTSLIPVDRPDTGFEIANAAILSALRAAGHAVTAIGFLRPGQPATVKFSAYDFAIYGGLDAVVEQISADSLVDEEGETFYLVRVRTLERSLGEGLPTIPGMLADVDVLTGKKSVLSYLVKPVLRARDSALTER